MKWDNITQRAAYSRCIDAALVLWRAGANNASPDKARKDTQKLAAEIVRQYPGRGTERETAEILMEAFVCGQKHAKKK